LDNISQAAALGAKAIDFSERMGANLPVFDLTGDARRYLARLTLLEIPAVIMRVRNNSGKDEIVAALVERLNDVTRAASVPGLLKVLVSESAELMIDEPLKEIGNLLAAADGGIRGNPGESEIFRAAVKTLTASSKHRAEAREYIARLVTEGIYATQLLAVLAENDVAAAASMIAPLIWKRIQLPAPTNGSWSDAIKKSPELLNEINLVLDSEFADQLPIELLRNSYESSYRNEELVTHLFEARVTRGYLGMLNSSTILKDLYKYAKIIRYSMREKFAEQLTGYQKFWPNIKTMPWSDSFFQTASLLKGGDSGDRLRQEFADRLEHAPAADWSEAIKKGSEPYKIATAFMEPGDLKLGVNSSLVAALIDTAKEVITGSTYARTRRNSDTACSPPGDGSYGPDPVQLEAD
jgi:hypothetical protein